MTNKDILDGLAKRAEENLQSEIFDRDKLLTEVFFPFIEQVLEYDTTEVGDITVTPAYTENAEYKLEFALAGFNPTVYKTCVKIVELGTEFKNEHANIQSALRNSRTNAEFIMITDCVNYEIFALDLNTYSLIPIGEFTLSMAEDNELFDMLRNPQKIKNKQEYAVRDDDDFAEPEEERIIALPTKKTVIETTENKKSPLVFFIIIAVIIGLIIAGVLGWLFLSDNSPLSFNGSQSKIDKGQLTGTLTVNSSGAHFSASNIPDGGIIKFESICGSGTSANYSAMIGGNASTAISLNGTCTDASVVAYLRFDEASHPQPSHIKEQFGSIGEKIIANPNAPDKFAITYVNFNVQNVLGNGSTGGIIGGGSGSGQPSIDIEQKRNEAFGNVEIRIDSVGNIKVLPKDFDMNKTNISESRNIYPQIYYNAKEKQSMMYIICGTINQMQLVRFTDVLFYADGYKWSYQVSSNPKEIDVTGGIAKEWVYFNDINSPSLLDHMSLLGQSEMSTITFKGDKIKEHQLTQKEKNTIAQMVSFYADYFGNGASAPERAWIEASTSATGSTTNTQSQSGIIYSGGNAATNSTNNQNTSSSSSNATNENLNINKPSDEQKTIDLKLPEKLLSRDYQEEKTIYLLIEKTNNSIKKGLPISEDEKELLSKLPTRFKDFSPALNKAAGLKSVTGSVVTIDNVTQTLTTYYKLYFKYDNEGKFEDGYVPYVIVCVSGEVYIPLEANNDNKFLKSKIDKDFITEILNLDIALSYQTY